MSLDYTDPDSGTSQRKQLEQVWKATGTMPTELQLPPLPEEIAYLREIFWDVWNSEGWSWAELKAYQEFYDIELDGSDVYILQMCHGACSKWISDKMRPKRHKGAKTPPKKRGTK